MRIKVNGQHICRMASNLNEQEKWVNLLINLNVQGSSCAINVNVHLVSKTTDLTAIKENKRTTGTAYAEAER